ncbi:hypothetical protein H671_6g15721 [Cricetulus griseus]|uniref:Uncharacterized protein n=1 Tax=Cricetulus griseus TaxID=10029 RepID=A0A061HZ03_CRIGR|nr:hypothetical protein H671_6g15721 [Cricetulus griseus]
MLLADACFFIGKSLLCAKHHKEVNLEVDLHSSEPLTNCEYVNHIAKNTAVWEAITGLIQTLESRCQQGGLAPYGASGKSLGKTGKSNRHHLSDLTACHVETK